MDLVDLYRDVLTVRKCVVLATWLPADSMVHRRMGGKGSQTLVEQALVRLGYGQEQRMYQASGGKGRKPSPPKLPPTYEEQRAAEQRHNARIDRYLAKYGDRIQQLEADTPLKALTT